MRKVTIFCDRCGKQIDTIAMWLHTFIYELPETEDADNVEEGAELCSDCYNEIDNMVAFMVKNPTIHFAGGKPIEAEPEKPKRATNSRKLDLDLGKIAALHNAGWTNRKIAEDMHVSDVTIANRLDEALEFLANKELQEVRNDE